MLVKNLFRRGFFCLCAATLAPAAGSRALAGTWTPLAHTAPAAVNTLLLLSDGTVMAADGGSAWYRLTPATNGSYVNGTWSALASMNYTRLYFSSDVLTNGRVFVAGAEYGTGTNSAEIYDPVANTWTATPPPPAGQSEFVDSGSIMLPNGNVLVTPVYPAAYGGTVIYNPAANTLSAGPTLYRGYYQDEATFVKLPDDSVLTIDPFGTNSERYIPSLNQWVNDANLPVAMYDPYGSELGAGFLLPDGRAFYLGATGNTVFYTPSGGTSPGIWTAGPVIPNSQATPDAPAAMMVNGKILCAVSPLPTSGNHFPSPTSFYEFDPVANTFTQVGGPTGSTYNSAPYVMRMLDLPDGTVLFSVSGSQLYVYSPGTAPLAAGKPAINSVSQNLDGTFQLAGTLLNGISQGASYGDDAQMDSNYPLVRMTNLTSGVVYYARTFGWNCTGVMQTGRVVSATFSLPAGLPNGNYNLVAVANGIASDPYPFTTTPAPLSLFVPASVVKSAGMLTNAGTILLGSALPTNLTVTLSSSAPSRLTVTPSVTILAGQTATNFSLAPVANQIQDGNTNVTVTAGAPGFTNVAAVVTVIDDNLPPALTAQPASQTLGVGGNASFSVSATGKSPLNYFWKRNGALISGATNSVYTTNSVQLADSGAQFSCLVTNAFGSTNSTAAVLTVQLNLVQNGGFEAGNFSGWTQSGNTAYTSVTTNSAYVHSGADGLEAGPSVTPGYLSQTLATTPGQLYLLSFWFDNSVAGSGASGGTSYEQLQMTWNGTNVFAVTNPPVLGWTNVLAFVTAGSGATVLQFGFRNDPAYFGIDDVSVVPVQPAVMQSVSRTNNLIRFSWATQNGLAYQLQYRTNLAAGAWTNLGSPTNATGAAITMSDAPGSDRQRFYRLLLLP